jgi:hypothetical protein
VFFGDYMSSRRGTRSWNMLIVKKRLEEVSSSLREISGKPLEKFVQKESSEDNVSLDGIRILKDALVLHDEVLEGQNCVDSMKESKPWNRLAGRVVQMLILRFLLVTSAITLITNSFPVGSTGQTLMMRLIRMAVQY